MEKNTKPIMVSICSITYNHAPYIRQCLDGFLMQKTNFRFEVIINDDCSNDGTTEILREYEEKYPDIIKPVYHEENLWSKGIRGMFSRFVYPKAQGKYCALCEGDDYWTDPYKLQKQVDFMESHPDYSFCCHRYKIFDQNKNRYLKEYGYSYYTDDPFLEISEEIFVKTWVTQILTTMIRHDSLLAVLKQYNKYKNNRDWHLYYYLLKEGKGASLNEIMGVYRWHDGGIASSLNGSERFISQYKVIKEIYDNHPDDVYLKYKIRYNLIRLLRYSNPSLSTYKYFKEALSCCNTSSQKLDSLISFLVPASIFNILSNYYSKKRLDRSEIK